MDPRTAIFVLMGLAASLGACSLLGPSDWEAWERLYGRNLDTGSDSGAGGETAVPRDTAAPEELCTSDWGSIETTIDREGFERRTVAQGSTMALLFDVEGRGDLCAQACDRSWVDPIRLTTSKDYNDSGAWVEIPHRLENDHVYALYYVDPDESVSAGSEVECWLDTSAGRYTFWVDVIAARTPRPPQEPGS